MQVPHGQVPKATAYPISHYGLAYRPAHDKAHFGRFIDIGPDTQMPDKERPAEPTAAPDSDGELGTVPHPRSRGQHRIPLSASRDRAGKHRAGQTLTRARPLRRRAESTARPARVRMRSRKPCVFARRRLFG
jgi:hypothetical protein